MAAGNAESSRRIAKCQADVAELVAAVRSVIRTVNRIIDHQAIVFELLHDLDIEGLPELPEPHPSDEERTAWQAFLTDHPELRGWIMEGGTCVDGVSTYPTRYHYYTLRGAALEPLVLAALKRGGSEGMTNQEILAAMYGTLEEAGASDGDRGEAQVVPGVVWSLTCRGVVERTRKRRGSTPALWRLKEADARR